MRILTKFNQIYQNFLRENDMNSHQIMPRYNAWANDKIYEMCRYLSIEAYCKDRQAFFGSIHNTLNHILLVDLLWVARLESREDESIKSLDQILYEEFNELSSARIVQDQRFIELVDGMASEEFDQKLKYQRMNGQQCEDVKGEMLITLYNHQTHHRGQVHTMLTQIGLNPPDMDVIDYLQADNADIS